MKTKQLKLEIGQAIKKCRKYRHLTQNDLAKYTGMHQAEISAIERGQANPTIETLNELARGMHVELTFKIQKK